METAAVPKELIGKMDDRVGKGRYMIVGDAGMWLLPGTSIIRTQPLGTSARGHLSMDHPA
jgi:hypothetical protein